MSHELLLWPLALAMALGTAGLVKWAADARTRVGAGVVLFLLVMMTAMLLGAAVYALAPSGRTAVLGLWVATALMSVSVFPLFLLILRSAQPGRSGTATSLAPPWGPFWPYVGSVVGLVLANELLMGWVFQLASGTPVTWSEGGVGGLSGMLAQIVDGPWFLFTMATEMAVTTALLWGRLSPPIRTVLLLQAGIMLLSPPALAGATWTAISIYAASGLMTVLFVYLMEYAYRTRQLALGFSAYIVRLLGVYALMMAGLFLWLVYGNSLAFAVAVLLEMVLFFDAVVRPDRLEAGDRVPWQLRPHWAFALLAGVFVSELFMGALLDAQIAGATFVGNLPAAPLSGTPLRIALDALYNGFWFIALVSISAWFLVMMGLEMGALVVLKIRETTRTELKLRLGIMLAAFWLFTVYFPSFWSTVPLVSATALSQVPVLGWGMGLGTGGPLAPAVFGAILVTYVLIGSASFLFGRRVLCSVLCNAPTMYQGTLVDAMGSFNRSSPIGRKYLGSRLSTTYSVTTGAVLVALVGSSVVSYLDAVGRLNVLVAGADPTVFLSTFSFGVLWYLMFVTIPYTGNYNCVTMGWCHWGTFSQLFSRFGFFRLKVKSREVCKACTTLDCAKSCPVGLVDMPGHFRTKGEFRSSKCCGVGDCVGACPYGNLEFHDVRHWIRARFGTGSKRARGSPLPMVSARARPGRLTTEGADPAAGVLSSAAPGAGLGR
ncbi:MAG: hypothetical protein L3K13_04240 [Thermoplasmata archaeon]|nr:hypothetical protein [Thermoplasmata archaeon]